MPIAVRVERKRSAELTDSEWEELWSFSRNYLEGSYEGLRGSFLGKRDTILIRARDGGRLVGTGSSDLIELEHEGRAATFIHAGNAVFDEQVRGQSIVQSTGFRYFLEARRRAPLRPVYLVYVTYSWRSYLMLVRNFERSWPRRDQPTPPWEAGAMRRLGALLYRDGWDEAAGLTRSTRTRRLLDDVNRIPDAMRDDPDLRFFAERNPEYLEGDSIITLTPLDAGNWWAVLRRTLARGRRR